MNIPKHIKEHAILGISGPGAQVITVGTTGRFKTIQSAIDFIETQENFTLLAKVSPAGTYIPGFGWINVIATASWVTETSDITITDTNNFTELLVSSGKTWLKVEDDGFFYPYETHGRDSTDITTIRTQMNRIEATISLVNDSKRIDFYTENTWTIKLTDPRYEELVTINADVCIRFEGSNSTWTHPSGANNSVISKGVNFKSGVLEFASVHLAEEGEFPWLAGSAGRSWEAIPANQNTIAFRFLEDCFIDSDASDHLSPEIVCGSVLVEGCRMRKQGLSGGAHFLFFSARGDVSVLNGVFEVRNNNPPGILTVDGVLFDATKARKLIVSNLSTVIDDQYAKINRFYLVDGAAAAPLVLVSDCSITTNSAIDSTPIGIGFVEQQGFATIQNPVANDVILNNLHINAPNIPDQFKTIFKGDVVATATVHMNNCSGGGVVLTGSDVCTSINHPWKQSVPYAASITPDANLGETIEVGVLTGAITINAPTNPQDSQRMRLKFTQDGVTGGYAVNFNAVFKNRALAAGGVNTKAIYDFEYDGTHWVQVNQHAWL